MKLDKDLFNEMLEGKTVAQKKEMYAKTLAKTGKYLNRAFRNLEEKGRAEESTAYKYARGELDKERPRYSENVNVYKNMNLRTLEKLYNQMEAKTSSRTINVRGLNQINRDKVSNSLEHFIGEEEDVTKAKTKKWQKFLETGGGELLRYFSSSQVFDDWTEYKRKGISDKEIIDAYNEFSVKSNMTKKKELDLTAVHNKFDMIIESKKERMNNND